MRAQVGNDNPTGPAGEFNGNVTTGCSYDAYTGNAKRHVTDIVVAGSVGAYPLAFSRIANSRGTQTPPTYPQFGEAGSWRHSYSWRLEEAFGTQPDQYIVDFPDGRYEGFLASSSDVCFRGGTGIRERFVPLDLNTMLAYLILPDGGKVEFTATPWYSQYGHHFYGYTFQTTAIIDPYGQRTSLAYNGDGSLNTISEPGGRWLQLIYVETIPAWYIGRPELVIDHVQASDGRVVHYNYGTAQFVPGAPLYTYLDNVVYPSDPGSSPPTAYYTYQGPNMPDYEGYYHGYPLLMTADDPMYKGPMKRITYTYATGNNPDGSSAVYGQILHENSGATGQAVSTLTVNGTTARTETRGDAPSRTFNYDGGKLINYTDFKGQPSYLGYDGNGYTSSFTDARSHTTGTTRESRIGALSVLTHPGDSSTVGYEYSDPNNPYYMVWRKDERDNYTYYDRDGNNRVWRIRYPDGSSETFTYNNFGQILTYCLTSTGTETFVYDEGINPPRGLLTSYIPSATPSDPNPGSHPTIYHYDPLDRIDWIRDPRNNVTDFRYNARGQLTQTIHPPDPVDGQRHSVVKAYNNDGTLATVTDELGHSTSYLYDDYKRPISVTNALYKTASFSYGPWNWSGSYSHTTSSVYHTSSPTGKVVDFDYDQNFRRSTTTQAPGTSDQATTTFTYDPAGNLETVTEPKGQPGQPYAGAHTTFGYDDRNRQTSAMDAQGHVTSTTYDYAGNKTTMTRPGNPPIQFVEYDPMNRLKHQIDERGVDTYMYYEDTARNLTSQKDGNNNTYSYTYDQRNRNTVMTYPDTSFEDFSYDAAGNMTIHRNRAGNHQYLSYDNRNRQYWFAWDDGLTQPQLTIYDAASRITSLQNSEADITLTYDNANRETSETEDIKSYNLYAQRSTVYQYDDDGNTSRLIYPQGYQFIYGYTQRNQLDNIKLDPAIFGGYYNTPVVHYTYDASGNRATRTVLSGAHAEYDNDELNRIRGQANYFANWQTGRFDYGFDVLGRRKYEQRDWWMADGYQYNARDELTGYQRDGDLNPDGTVSASFWNNTGLQYDNNGNRTQVTGSGAASYTHNSLNQYGYASNLGGLGYDPKGNLNSVAGWTYTYDAQNRLTRMENGGTVIVQTYDPLNRVITRNVNGAVTQNVWEGWNLIEEHRPDWSIQRCYLYGAGQNEMVAAFDGGIYSNHWFWQDGRDNTSHITGDNAALLERYTYDLNGAPKFYDEWGGERGVSFYDTRFLFGGSQYLPDTGLYEMRNRFYHIALNRFLETDPIGFAGDVLNLYRYCGNDPVNGSDPFGLQTPDMNGQGEATTEPIIVNGYDPFAHETLDLFRNTRPLDSYFNTDNPFDTDPFRVGDNLVSPTYFQPTEPTRVPASYRDFGPSSEELTPLQAAVIGLYLAVHGDFREGLFARTAMGVRATTVIGRTGNLRNLRPGEQSLLGRLPNLGNPQRNWQQNSGVLRQEMNRGLPIRDASPNDVNGVFLNAERGLLQSRGWTFDPKTNLWMPPKG